MDKGSKENTGILYIVATPIGNLGDISSRGLEVLSQVDYIAAEDTRHSGIMLTSFGIKGNFISYHDHNRQVAGERILEILKAGKTVALISDAGMPCISDPGYELVDTCHKAGISVSVLPGPSAAITALAGSGFQASSFVFDGFLPIKGKARKEKIKEIADRKVSSVFYEAPHRVFKTLNDLAEACESGRRLCLGRELTKLYEEYIRLDLGDSAEFMKKHKPRGEYVFVLEGKDESSGKNQEFSKETLIISALLLKFFKGKSLSEAVEEVSRELKAKKNTVYDIALRLKGQAGDTKEDSP